mmetsp:Transcript_14242/g.29744  ORF Transcript_14242/g.29744 Transcript_14242/m.29744 type:complete len:101 (-) Transcript_14242:188-490(-)|eukprot:CAMPEP_0201230962 /NCGR_PEP_ID=MMETSP0852-20130820/2604_1 /ASSEMBLY_ACC=CAM_ASM_000632 /TAXON_ID=183588 /ORGANISM="Pseudo-nitzschia fraudulenta, Strain WWA7" /LENGTH=100 /DNA_ID=CAMNT_0047522351 /DNA_START=148 /DNA_END=450 /DNA_ORIENTATION=-
MPPLKPGQKYPTPTPGFGDRVFYESLLKQRQTSEMAQDWCLNYGILSHKKAEKLLVIVTERKRRQRMGITGGSAAKSRSTSPAPPKKKKAKVKKEETGDM